MTQLHDTPGYDGLRLYAQVPRTRALGPFRRFALWVQGCHLGCPGCMTPDALPFDGGRFVSIESLAAEILAVDDIEGLTISGGEPFSQAAGLTTLMGYLRSRRDLGLILYSGYRLRDLQRQARRDAGVARLLAEIDLLIDGPYRAARNDGAPLRGSANQKVWPLTERYLPNLQAYSPERSREVELHVAIGERMLVGIPSARQLAWWQQPVAKTQIRARPRQNCACTTGGAGKIPLAP